MYTGYFGFAGNELVNSARAVAYATNLGIASIGCRSCDTLSRALWDQPYTTPSDPVSEAPWFDLAVPESKEFAGLYGLSVNGLGKTTGFRNIIPSTGNGAALRALRRGFREIQIKVLALAASDAGLSYGLDWLASALRGGVCSGGCSGDNLCFFTACPPGCDHFGNPVDPDAPECCDPPPDDGSLDPCGTRYYRTMFDVGLQTMDEPDAMSRLSSGGWLTQVTFTLAAGNPWIYQNPVLVARGPAPGQILPNYQDPGLPPNCNLPGDCLRDSSCPPVPLPVLPPVPVDSCWPSGPFTASRVMLTLPTHLLPAWSEKVPYITVAAGSLTLRRLTLRWYANPGLLDCAVPPDPCNACAEVSIAQVPRGTVLTIDGRTETATVDCSGGAGLSFAEPVLYGRGGTPFVWPLFTCSDGMCLEMIAEADSVAPDAQINVYFCVRGDAA